jgi:acyl-[acyl-carrier-protein]-phospholipid O-acyltransferase/long-chain-fatty-acid--[acyl-carrier-protein] ligase
LSDFVIILDNKGRKKLTTENKMSRSFDWHNATQFLGALNDNVFRWLMVFFLIGLLGDDKASSVTSLTGVVFVVPFLLFTPLAGVVADRFSKQDIIVKAKMAELVLMVAGWIVFTTQFAMGIYVVLFLMCTQSAFFGPCKYGIIPELVPKDQISRANSFLEGMTYLSIVIGTAFAPWLANLLDRNFMWASLACVVFAAVGVLTSLRIGRTEPVSSEEKLSEQFSISEMSHVLKTICADKYLLMTVLASAYFMLLGGFSQINMIPYGMEVCNFTDMQSGYLFLIAAVGIGIGSWLAGKLSGRNVEFGIVPMGAIGMAVTAAGLGWIGLHAPVSGVALKGVFVLIFIFGVGSGLFIVPIHAFIQIRAPEQIRARVIAASSFLGWIGVLLASGLLWLCCGVLGIRPSTMFLGLGILTFVLAVATVIVLPDFLVRLILVLLTRTIYRIRTHGQDNVPAEGPALIVSNHVSWADAVVLMATQQRRIRFVMDRQISQNRWIGWIFRLGKVIPISATDPPKKIVAALREARQAMDDGYLVCIFAEGTLTRTGMLNKFRAGFEKITKGTDYQIIPTYIGGLWGSVLSHYHGKILGALPRKLPYPVGVLFGEPMPANASAQDLRLRIEELSVDFYNAKKTNRLSLGERFIKSARRHWTKPCMSDTLGKKLNFGKTLIASVALAEKLKVRTVGQQNVGIFLPSSVGGALANLATALLNKTAVNLSYTASVEDRRYMIETAGIKTVLTSRKFIEKLDLDRKTLPGVIFVEDIVRTVSPSQKRRALLRALFTPKKRLAHRPHNFCADDTAVILFSSGSSGRPKGVELSHHNIQSNLEGALAIFQVFKDDRLCGVLPLFHAFGLSCTLWLPIMAGVGVSFCPNPLDAKVVGRMCGKDQCTLLFATPTFLQNYLRRCKPEDFADMRFIIAGAEKLKPELMDAFEEKFGLRPYEGYGATECSPLIALNVPSRQVRVRQQVGCKEGTVGHTVPGLAVKVLDTQTSQPVSTGEQGLLYVKGPNVMAGYLKLPEKTAEVLIDGWYNTGDIVSIDADGFVTIRDRFSRFSKIGGEMVPHMTIEEVCQKGLGIAESVVAVTSVPDAKKGEQIVILYDKEKVDADALQFILAESDLPKLYIPKKGNLIAVDGIPHLGSGKLDIMKLRQIASERITKNETG